MNRAPFLSGINPNSSSTNLSKIPHERLAAPKPKRINLSNQFGSFQMPMTPPVSKASTPTNEPSQTSWIPPIDLRITTLCTCWYVCSIISNNSTKMVLSRFSYPVTLTQFQFLMNSLLSICMMGAVTFAPGMHAAFPKGVLPPRTAGHVTHTILQFLTPTALVIATTLPMGCFQFVGHITSHKATSVIPVSLVHTIKALSPLVTVLVYRTFYHIRYRTITYVTLLPLVVGIMLSCFKGGKSDISGASYVSGLVYAFVSMLIFVSQNIFAKKRLTIEKQDKILLPTSNSTSPDKKLDKLTILFYCSVIGFVLTMPVYLLSECTNTEFSLAKVTPTVAFLVVVNGASHFLQSLLAFQLLGVMSPINYSIANILKRIIIILVAFLWENKAFTRLQGVGLVLTLGGLYCYDRWGVRED